MWVGIYTFSITHSSIVTLTLHCLTRCGEENVFHIHKVFLKHAGFSSNLTYPYLQEKIIQWFVRLYNKCKYVYNSWGIYMYDANLIFSFTRECSHSCLYHSIILSFNECRFGIARPWNSWIKSAATRTQCAHWLRRRTCCSVDHLRK